MALQIAILVYPQMTALDAVGPYEVLSRIPGAQVSWVAQDLLPVTADAGLTLVPTATFATLTRPEVVVVPGGREGFAIREPAILAWLRAVHPHTRFTTSVCTGALVLGAAGLLRGVRATTHWYKLSQLKTYGARPTRRRVVQDGRIVTAAGVSAGIDMGLTLVQRLAGTTAAKVIQLGIEYDPHPPFQSGSPHSASWLTRGIAYLAMRRYNAVRPNTSQ
jgi:transcriptional regulator GlxA family with amidase domain